MFDRKKNILVTGAKGQLGSYLVKELNKIAFKKKSIVGQVHGIDIDDLDLIDSCKVADFFNRHVVDPSIKIGYVVHCAAATDTTAIEKDPWKYYAANVIAAKNVAESCAYNNIKLIHISTDYVFSELSPKSCGGARIEHPINQYGMQKLLAEKEVQVAYASKQKDLAIGRLSWLFGNSTNSFPEKLLKSIFKTYVDAKDEGKAGVIKHKVADDAYGRPTPTWLVLDEVMKTIEDGKHGIFNFQYWENPQISRFEWASMIWTSFCKMLESKYWQNLEKDIVEPISKHISEMTSRIELEGIQSSELNLSMNHPGLVEVNTLKKNVDVYEQCTNDYIEKNHDRLIKMMVDFLKDVK